MKFLSQKNSGFRFFLALSFAGHIGLILPAFLFSHFFLFKTKEIKLINAIQVDSIELSDLNKLSPDPKISRPKVSHPKVSRPKVSRPKVSQQKQSLKPSQKDQALKKVKNIALKQPNKAQKKEKNKPDKNKAELKPLPDKNKVKPLPDENREELKSLEEPDEDKKELREDSLKESSEPPESSDTPLNKNDNNSNSSDLISGKQMSELSYYASQISMQAKRNWNLPSYLTNQALTTQVEININSEGTLIYKQILISSGDDLYDSFVLKAIEKASPYPKPFPSVQKIIQGGIVLNMSSQ